MEGAQRSHSDLSLVLDRAGLILVHGCAWEVTVGVRVLGGGSSSKQRVCTLMEFASETANGRIEWCKGEHAVSEGCR